MSKFKLSEKEFVENWEITRRKGFIKYILIQGGLSWGIFSGIIYIILIKLLGGFLEMPSDDSLFMNIYFQLAIFFIFGAVIGVINWYRNEKRYLKRKPYNK